MIKCIIFDCDGTLVDSEYLCNLGLEIKLRDYGVESSAIDLMKRFRGGKLATILEAIESEHQIKLKEDFVSSYRSLVDELFEKDLKPCEGVNTALTEIELPKCVASSGPLEKINKALSISGLSKYFNGKIFSSYVVGSWKPDPGIFLHAAKEMGFQPKECAVVEDSQAGISAAKSAGMRPILYDPNNIYDHTLYSHTINHMRELQGAIT
ncbi:HAD-IA family hydrolase [Dasania sp. GY-MA-18]|uniref:HAD-IA family hydrolase n=1 Tax=Dasania phycosphaerae TaxID=2950436 RepID=A0A9J6RN85_9GAMM|nr:MULTISPECIES: HAD-IA family hydrolase [Dasania]MCR8923378.1 HAD-IA family hydrolase [Dasania sp. GY-MA-18]MCZ0865810.1 HAD-IA family hydrolase [Dasania phycosphaerae]MCZ0869535.1 HAD-IA family hydrolase [Dasania phycosphaerae]